MICNTRDEEAPENDDIFPLDRIVRLLALDDPVDLLTAIAGLQLMPENADRGVRLDALAHVCAARRPWRRTLPVRRARLRRICDTPALQRLRKFEDPFPNPFTETVTFFGGGFIVFPGRFDETTFVLRQLIMVVFRSSIPFPDDQFVMDVRGLIAVVLAISDAMAHRVGLGRGIIPPERKAGSIVVPNAERLHQLKRAVRFRRSDLTNLLVANGVSPDMLDDLITPIGQVSLTRYQLDTGELFARPLVSVGDHVIVALPGQLLAAVRHAIIRRAHDRGLVDELAYRYAGAIAFTAHESLALLGHHPIPLRPATIPDVPLLGVGFHSLDTDKLLYVMLLTDPLQSYQENAVYTMWDMSASGPTIEEHLRAIAATVREEIDPAADMLCLLLVQGVGHVPLLSLPDDDLPLTVVMSVADLQTIAWLPDRDQLTLWKFARAADRVRHHAHVYTTSLLDEYEWYRRNGHSYGMPDPEAEAVIVLFPVGAGRLRREVIATYDRHTVRGYQPDSLIEVFWVYGPGSAPISAPAGVPLDDDTPVAIVVEGCDLPIWVTGPLDALIDSVLRPIYVEFTDAIAYWLWRCGPQLTTALASLAATAQRLHVQVQLADSEAWKRPWTPDSVDGADIVVVHAHQENTRIEIVLPPAAQSLFAQPDNAGERALLSEILNAIRMLLASSNLLDEHNMAEMVDLAVPTGGGKRIVALYLGMAVELDPRGLPRHRSVTDADTTELLDELALHLKRSDLSPGAIIGEQRKHLADLVVTFFYQQLETLVATLDSDGLLEHLIGQHEALVHRNAAQELQAHNPLGLRDGHARAWIVDVAEWTETAMASRFLLEYVVARPPTGGRVFSLDTYDRLLALGFLIVRWGLISDLIHYQVVDVGIELQESGRIRLDRQRYASASAAYLATLAGRKLPSMAEFLERYMPTEPLAEQSAMVERFDRAAVAEWGLTLSEIILFLDEATLLGQEQDTAAALLPVDIFESEMAQRLSWSREHVGQALDLLSLSPRDDFLKPPAHVPADVYPWQFNRALSYVRRPFLIRRQGDTTDVVWGRRHVSVAREHMLRLCFERRLQANSLELRQLLGEMNAQVGEPFNDEVADLFRRHDSMMVHTRVKRIGKLRVPGDIDVLVIDQQRHRLLLLECKRLAIARSPQELGREMQTLFTRGTKTSSVVARHQERVAWFEARLDAMLLALSIDTDAPWVVQGMIVVDTELFTPFLVAAPMPVVSFAELAQAVERERG